MRTVDGVAATSTTAAGAMLEGFGTLVFAERVVDDGTMYEILRCLVVAPADCDWTIGRTG